MADEQKQNPFDDFQPSWLKKSQARSIEAAPVINSTTPLSDEDILLQEVVAPLRATHNSANQTATFTSPSGIPAYFTPPITSAQPEISSAFLPDSPAPLITTETAAPPLAAKSKPPKPPKNKGWWVREVLILVIVLAVIAIGYVIYIQLQASQRTANSFPASDVAFLTHYSNSYGIALSADELKKLESGAAIELDKIDKYGCYRSSYSAANVENFYQGQLEKKNYATMDIPNQASVQNWAWSDTGRNGVILSAYAVGWFDTGFFNQAAPGETIFCVFTGKLAQNANSTTNGTDAPAPAPAPVNSGGNGGGDNNSGGNGDNPVVNTPVAGPTPKPAPTSKPQTPGRTVAPSPTKPPPPTPTTNPLEKGA